MKERLGALIKEWSIPLVVGIFMLWVYLPDPRDVDSSRAFSEAVKIWLTIGGVLLAAGWKALPRGWGARLLIALTLCAGLNYYRYTPDVAVHKIDSYDLIHYYLGAKYFDELGYYDLYPAALLVDHEHGEYNRRADFFRSQTAEDGYRERVPVRQGIERGKEVRKRFPKEKWEAFEHDFLTLQRDARLGRNMWKTLINDRGFNGTPAWLVVARPIAKLFPVEWIKALCYLDVVLLLAGLFALGWAYGWLTPLWALFFLFVTYSLRWPYVTWAFLRYDWVAALMIAMALLKKNKWAAAGAVTGYAALVRLFPAAWMFGPFAKGVAGLFKPGKPLKERFDKRMLLVGGGFLAFVFVLEGTAVASFGMDAVKTHAGNIAEHIKPEELSSRRIGFALAYSYDGQGTPKWLPDRRKLEIKEDSPERLVLAGILLVILGWALRKRRPDEAFALGFLPFFMLATASYYYLVCRITLIAWHASDLGKARNRVGLAWLLGLEFLSNYSETMAPGYRVLLIGHLAWGLLAYAIGMTGWLTWEAGMGRDVKEEPPDERPLVDGEPDWRQLEGASAAESEGQQRPGGEKIVAELARPPPAKGAPSSSNPKAKAKGKKKGGKGGKGKKS